MKQRGFAPIIILILFTAVLAGGFYLYKSGFKLNRITQPSSFSNKLSPAPSTATCDFSYVSSKKDSKTNLTVTVDTKNNFQITYPSDWEWQPQTCDEFSNSNIVNTKVSGTGYFQIYSPSKFMLLTGKNYNSAEDLVKGKYTPGREPLPRMEERQLLINTYPAKRVFGQTLKGDNSSGGIYQGDAITSIEYLIAKNNKVYLFKFQINGESYNETIKEVDSFMQTFK